MPTHNYGPGYELVHQFYEEFVRRTGMGGFPAFGTSEKDIPKHEAVPRIVLIDTGGGLSLAAKTKTGDPSGDLGEDATTWDLYIWAEDRKQCRELYLELLRAMRDVLKGQDLELDYQGTYVLSGRHESTRSRLLTHRDLTILIPVAQRTTHDFQLVEVRQFDTEIGPVETIPADPTDANLKSALGAEKLTITQTPEE